MEAIHRAKTGALIRVSVVAGGVLCRGDGGRRGAARRLRPQGRPRLSDCRRCARHDPGLGALGKTAGKDLATEKATWPAVFGIEQSERHAAQLIEEAFAALQPYGERADGLKAVARYLVERKS